MKCVYESDIEKKAELSKLLEADPYGMEHEDKKSFSRLGYKLKDGVQVGCDEKKIYVFFRGSDDYAPFVESKLKDLAKRCDGPTEQKIISIIEDEESGAEQGMGAIFG
ncbi:MAG: hypothetical protein V1822_02840 [Candidatus Micrarchaeota archaeon]